MTQANFEAWLDEAVTEVLESMCFLSPDGEESHLHGEAEDWVHCRLEFRGPFEGSLGLRSTVRTCTTIAGNLLGQEPEELSMALLGDSIGEIANMVCGAVLGRAEKSLAFDLTPPYADEYGASAEASQNRITRRFLLKGGSLTAWLEISQSS